MTTTWPDTSASPLRYPTTEAEWRDAYQRRIDAFQMQPYSAAEAEAYHLFSAMDLRGNEIARTHRVFRDYVFIVERGAESLFGGGLSLELQGDLLDQADTERDPGLEQRTIQEGEAVLRRSNFANQLSRIGWACAGPGRCGIELVRMESSAPYRTKMVFRDPRIYAVVFDDATDTEVRRVAITNQYFTAEELDQGGDAIASLSGGEGATLNIYTRILTPETITVSMNGDPVPSESGAHNLGHVPFVNLVWGETDQPGHGVGAGFGILSVLAAADSLVAQVHAIATRYGAPMPYLKGASLGGAPGATTTNRNVGRFGTWMHSLPANAELGYLEPSGNPIKELLLAVDKCLDRVRQTFPVFAVFSGGASASGEALRTLSAAYVASILKVRGNILPELARAVDMAVAMDRGVHLEPDRPVYRFVAGPVLPSDKKAELEALEIVRQAGMITPGDYVRHLQTLGVIDKAKDPETYATEAQDRAGMAQNTFGGVDPTAPPEAQQMVDNLTAMLETAETVGDDLREVSELLAGLEEASEVERADIVGRALAILSDATAVLADGEEERAEEDDTEDLRAALGFGD